MDAEAFKGLDVDRALVMALTACALGDSHSTAMCGTIMADAMSFGKMDDQAMYSVMVFINKVVVKWVTRMRWATRGPDPAIANPTSAAALARLLAHGSALQTSGLVVLRYLMDWLVQYSAVVACQELDAWQAMPGFTVVLELLQRGEHRPRGRAQLVTSVWTCAQSIMSVLKMMIGSVVTSDAARSSTSPFSTTLAGTLSLSGTLRKIVRRTERQDDVASSWSDLDYGKLSEAFRNLCDTIHTLLFLHGVGEEAQQRWAGPPASSAGQQPLRSLDAILRLAKLLHVSSQGALRTLLRARGPSDGFRASLRYYDGCALGKLDGRARMMELFVALDGRVLPGCCNPTCDNLAGVSEAALKTHLCGGCRRARYCSRWCQRQDVLNGHGSTCNKVDS